ncbi:hypothetical protein BTO06_06155 [Tenacibaculum sp. SZ-18]|uniref:hypothetical protein n=1 Tax=Tenacibaculum sp. SZ-18 TaxID=754423 RepID=UPI000C2CFD08|nr:hypothetical protein [Tenacibaculum sp. SZ-18]AUC14752.1 hypothetical protein BTO06_06155 [Tenacibaculum sp. SZ-18]
MKKAFLLIFVSLSFYGFSQDKSSTKFWDNVRFGGAFGLGFGNNTTNIAIIPSAIYDFNEYVSLGVSLGYQYAKRDNAKSNVYSAGLLSFFKPINQIQLSAEFEQLFVNTSFGNLNEKYNYPSLNLGAAYQVSKGIAIGLRYDVLFNGNKSIYVSAFSPIVRIFF